MASVIDKETEKLGRLIAQLLDISRVQNGQLALDRSEFDIVELCSQVVERAQSQSHRSEITLEGGDPILITADALRIEQVLVNLVDNAVEAMERKGHIVVEAQRDAANSLVRVIVADDGPGIPPAERDKLQYEPVQPPAQKKKKTP